MAYSGLSPESFGNYEGMDGLRLVDLKELELSDEIQFDKVPVTVMVRSKLSKAPVFLVHWRGGSNIHKGIPRNKDNGATGERCKARPSATAFFGSRLQAR